MENTIKTNTDFSLIQVIPHLKQINSIYTKALGETKLSFADQRIVSDYYNQYNDTGTFDRSILNFILSSNKEAQVQIIQVFRTEINKNNELYSKNNVFFDEIDTEKICFEYTNQLGLESKILEKIGSEIWDKLKSAKIELEDESRKCNSIERLLREVKQLQKEYDQCKDNINTARSNELKIKLKAYEYRKNLFDCINELSESFQINIDKYFIDNTTEVVLSITNHSIIEEYFDMNLALSIYDECNNKQFNDMHIIDFYSNLNLLPTKTTLKHIEKDKVTYIIHKLYNHLKNRMNQNVSSEWRKGILQNLNIPNDYYNSKYTVFNTATKGTKHYEFSQSINLIIK